MAEVYKILGQSRPNSTSNANLYVVASGSSAVISTISITNTSSEQANARIFIREYNAPLEAASEANAIIYDMAITPNELFTITAGITLASQDTITVQSSV